MRRKPIDRDQVIAALRGFADELEAGYRSVPEAGVVLRRVAGVRIVPVAIHDAVCGWRVLSEQEGSDPRVGACAGCGLGMLLDDELRDVR